MLIADSQEPPPGGVEDGNPMETEVAHAAIGHRLDHVAGADVDQGVAERPTRGGLDQGRANAGAGFEQDIPGQEAGFI
jgi:hypothetical protein